jgi:hypothetical protein
MNLLGYIGCFLDVFMVKKELKNKFFYQKNFCLNFSIITMTENWTISNNTSFDFFLEKLGLPESSKIKKNKDPNA